MYSLIKFRDNIHYVCKSNQIVTNKNGIIKATWSDGRKYEASIIAKNSCKTVLEEVKHNMLINKPHILCTKTDENANNKNYNSKKNTPVCNDTDLNSMDGNKEKSNIVMANDCEIKKMIDIYGKAIDGIHRCNIDANDSLGDDVSLVDLDSISLSDLLNGSLFADKNNCVRKLSFNSVENTCMTSMSQSVHEVCNEDESNDATHQASSVVEDTCIASTCQSVNQMYKEDEINNVICQIPSVLAIENNGESSGSEYIPESEHVSSEDEHMSSENESNISHNHKSQQKRRSVLNTTDASTSNLDASQINNNVAICNDETMYVETSKKHGKRNYCVFCGKLQTQLARHLQMIHSNESEVKKFAVLPKKNSERRKIIDILRKNGNFKFNTNVDINNGQLIVCRRPNEKHSKSATDFTACAKCKGFFVKSTIRYHSRHCLGKDFKKNRCIMVMGRRITCRLHSSANDTLKNMVFPVMREDEVTRLIRYDELLISYANTLCIKYKSQHHHDMIRARMRVLGRFLLALKNINTSIENFESVYHPKVYDDCIRAINTVAKYNIEEQMYESPAVAANLSTLIKHVGNLFITTCIKREDTEKKRQTEDFLKLLIVDVTTGVNTTVAETQSARKRHKRVNLPSTEDITKLYKYLKKKRDEAFTELQLSFSYSKWLTLTEVTLTSVHVFNRRRAGEMERILIEDFKSYEKLNKNMYSDIYNTLSNENKKIAEKYVRFCIRGKLGRTVPVLLSNDLFKCITSILKYRKAARVPDKNPYVFGLPGFNKQRYKYLRACVLIRKFAEECNAVHSTTLRGTALRKHVATYCIQLNLNDVDISDLATFMGHSDKIHKDHYRQPLASRDILKISQYLEAVQGELKEPDNESSTDSFGDDENPARSNFIENVSPEDDMSAEINIRRTSDDVRVHDQQEDNNNNGKRKRSKTRLYNWTQSVCIEIFLCRYTEDGSDISMLTISRVITYWVSVKDFILLKSHILALLIILDTYLNISNYNILILKSDAFNLKLLVTLYLVSVKISYQSLYTKVG